MILATLVLAAGLLLASTPLGTSQEKTGPAWVDARILEIKPTAEERKFDTIAWVPSIREALKLAKEHNRPLMMFTYDGQMQTGRC
jgi:hypothetical protein